MRSGREMMMHIMRSEAKFGAANPGFRAHKRCRFRSMAVRGINSVWRRGCIACAADIGPRDREVRFTPARFEQRSDRTYQLRTPRDQLLGSHGEDIELGAANDETEIFEKAANKVLEIALNLDQQRPAGQ